MLILILTAAHRGVFLVQHNDDNKREGTIINNEKGYRVIINTHTHTYGRYFLSLGVVWYGSRITMPGSSIRVVGVTPQDGRGTTQ